MLIPMNNINVIVRGETDKYILAEVIDDSDNFPKEGEDTLAFMNSDAILSLPISIVSRGISRYSNIIIVHKLSSIEEPIPNTIEMRYYVSGKSRNTILSNKNESGEILTHPFLNFAMINGEIINSNNHCNISCLIEPFTIHMTERKDNKFSISFKSDAPSEYILVKNQYESFCIHKNYFVHTPSLIKYFRERSNISHIPYYWISRTSNTVLYHSTSPFPIHSTNDMMTYFGNNQRRGTKMDTLLECLREAHNQNMATIPNKKKFIITISPYNVDENKTFRKYWTAGAVLGLSRHLKVLAIDKNNNIYTYLVEYDSQSEGDFVQMLYSNCEEWKKESRLYMYMIDADVMEASFEKIGVDW